MPPDSDDMDPSIPKERSRAHHSFTAGKVKFLSLDMEHAGEYVGIIQLSAELFQMELVQKGGSARSDSAQNIVRNPTTFNEYVNPESEMEWEDNPTVLTHGLTAADPRIANADRISVVWARFCT